MRTISATLLLGLLVVGCSEKKTATGEQSATKVAQSDPKFDQDWSKLAQTGVEALYIEDDRGQGLMGNVRRASSMETVPAAVAPVAPRDPNGPLPDQPAGEEVQKVIKQNLANVKACYLRMTREGSSKSGKAIVSFQIGPDGRVAGVKVDAPSFDGTVLPTCMTGQISNWAFPKSTKGGLAVSYPFVFVGG